MKLSAATLTIELRLRRTVDDEDWVRVQVLAAANGFHGDFEAWLQLGDLVRFREEIEVMHSYVGQALAATLSSAEPGIKIELNMQPLGGIEGTYAFESERPTGTPTVLSGGFEIDQSYLPGLRDSLADLIASLAERLPSKHLG
jgi:hypothetical protein